MELTTVRATVIEALSLTNQTRSDETQIPLNDSVILFGSDGYLDSMALVALLMDIEDALQEQNIDVSLSDEKAMSSTRSPFKDIPSITQYIYEVIAMQA